MGNIFTCDNCKRVIKDKEKRWVIAINEITNEIVEESYNPAMQLANYYRQQNKMIALELCDDCKKILDYLFKIRKDRLAAILREIKSSYICDKHTKYCKCGKKYQDSGLLISGIEDGICYICGKPKRPLTKKELHELLEKEEENE